MQGGIPEADGGRNLSKGTSVEIQLGVEYLKSQVQKMVGEVAEWCECSRVQAAGYYVRAVRGDHRLPRWAIIDGVEFEENRWIRFLRALAYAPPAVRPSGDLISGAFSQDELRHFAPRVAALLGVPSNKAPDYVNSLPSLDWVIHCTERYDLSEALRGARRRGVGKARTLSARKGLPHVVYVMFDEADGGSFYALTEQREFPDERDYWHPDDELSEAWVVCSRGRAEWVYVPHDGRHRPRCESQIRARVLLSILRPTHCRNARASIVSPLREPSTLST